MAFALKAAMRLARSAAFLAASSAGGDGASEESGDIGIPGRVGGIRKGRRKGGGKRPTRPRGPFRAAWRRKLLVECSAHSSSGMTTVLPFLGRLAGGWTGLRSALLSWPGPAPPFLPPVLPRWLRPVRAFQKRVQKPGRADL